MKMPLETLIATCIAVAAIEAALHWFPWDVMPIANRKTGELEKPWTYIVGLVPILLAFAGWILRKNPHRMVPAWMAVTGITAISVAAGASILCAYIIDWARARYWRKRLGELDGRNHRSTYPRG